MTLGQLGGHVGAGTPGTSAAEDAWAAARASQPGWLTGPEADAAACDATVIPVVTGHVDQAALDRLIDAFLISHDLGRHTGPPGAGSPSARPGVPVGPGQPAGSGQPGGSGQQASADHPIRSSASGRTARPAGEPAAADRKPPRTDLLSPATRDRLRRALLGLAADALSGPGGLAARLRAALDGTPLTTVSLPLDIGAAAETIPAHLRRAAATRTAPSPAATSPPASATSTT